MSDKLKLWKPNVPFDEAEKEWDTGAAEAKNTCMLKGLRTLPKMPGITPKTAKYLKFKSIHYMLRHDKGCKLLRQMFRHPFKYTWRLLCSLMRKKSYSREGDFFYYGIDNEEQFAQLLADKRSIFLIGFAFCHKPFECPSGRFSQDCIHDASNPVCRQCFIGKSVNALPERQVIPVFITTVHHIGDEMFKAVHTNRDRNVHFLITACELCLEMFADWGNMLGVKGIGVRLDGRICNTMDAFKKAEVGIKPGLTVVLDETQKRILKLIEKRRNSVPDPEAD